MLLPVLNAGATPQTEIVRGQETLVDISGTLAATDTWQPLAPSNPTRSGVVMQNLGMNPMSVCELTQDADPTQPPPGALFWNVPPGGYWPPPGFPTTVGPILVQGTLGDTWAGRDY